jgi:hypothetical protein
MEDKQRENYKLQGGHVQCESLRNINNPHDGNIYEYPGLLRTMHETEQTHLLTCLQNEEHCVFK